MIRRADVFTVDREEIAAVCRAWEKIEPFIPAKCDPEYTRTVRNGLYWLRMAAQEENANDRA
jgi:hypothetical protein